MDSLIEVVVTEKVLFLPRRTIGVKLVRRIVRILTHFIKMGFLEQPFSTPIISLYRIVDSMLSINVFT
jgi:hypothetical protein